MKYYFEDKNNQERLFQEMKEWMDTPFRHLAGVKQVGADCIHFVCGVYENIGAVKDASVFIPRYTRDWCQHSDEQKLYNGIRRKKEFVEVGIQSPMNGDLLLYQFGKAASHCGIYFEDQVYQALERIGVHKLAFEDQMWRRRLRFGFRVCLS